MDFIKKNIEQLSYKNGNHLNIYSGKCINEHIFQDKYNFIEYPDYMNIIPLITSSFSLIPSVYKISETINEPLIHIIKEKIIENGKSMHQKHVNDKEEEIINNQLIQTCYQYNNNNHNKSNHYLLKYYKKEKVPSINFSCSKKYNFKNKYLRIKWENHEYNYSILLDLYVDYFKLGVNINIPENVELVPLRKKYIWEDLSLFNKIISQLKSNN
tara:strand:+ start:7287 stop:7925 length:639 start_codon:yes stop_codon:yes gene_type:complete